MDRYEHPSSRTKVTREISFQSEREESLYVLLASDLASDLLASSNQILSLGDTHLLFPAKLQRFTVFRTLADVC